jgi:hypothetical protein
MRLKAIVCQVFTREMSAAGTRSPHEIEVEFLTMGLHDLGAEMRSHLQARIDASDVIGYDAILLGYGLCGRGTEGLRAGNSPLVLPRVHDCIGILMGSRRKYETYFEEHPGTYYRSPGWVEFQAPGQWLQPAQVLKSQLPGERRSREELIAQSGEENGNYLFGQFSSYRRRYSGLTYIPTGVPSDDACRVLARKEAEREGWTFDEVKGSLTLLERMVCGAWDEADFLVVPPGATVRCAMGDNIVDIV